MLLLLLLVTFCNSMPCRVKMETTPRKTLSHTANSHWVWSSSLNIGPYPWKNAFSREHWRSIVDTATHKKSMPWRERYTTCNCCDAAVRWCTFRQPSWQRHSWRQLELNVFCLLPWHVAPPTYHQLNESLAQYLAVNGWVNEWVRHRSHSAEALCIPILCSHCRGRFCHTTFPKYDFIVVASNMDSL